MIFIGLARYGFSTWEAGPFSSNSITAATLLSVAADPCSYPERTSLLTADVPAASSSFGIGELRERPGLKEAFIAQRTTQAIVRFSTTFLLPGFDEPQPPGDYRVDHDEEAVGGAAWFAWRRVRSYIHLPALGSGKSTHQMVPVTPDDLDAAIKKDQNS